MSVSLFLMGKKGVSVLKKIISIGKSHLIERVIIARDKNVENDCYNNLREICLASDIECNDKNDLFVITSQYCIAVSWRWMISLSSGVQLIILHDSLLPKYRGFAPLVNMLINKEPYIGVSAIFADSEFDKGNLITQESVPVSYPIKIDAAIDMISPLYANIVCDILEKVESGIELPSIPQNEKLASYSLWRDEEDYRIDWNMDSSDIMQFVYSVGFPYKGASTMCAGNLLRIYDCELYNDVNIENRISGKVLFCIDNCPVVVCGTGLLKITQLYDCCGNSCLPLKKFRLKFK